MKPYDFESIDTSLNTYVRNTMDPMEFSLASFLN